VNNCAAAVWSPVPVAASSFPAVSLSSGWVIVQLLGDDLQQRVQGGRAAGRVEQGRGSHDLPPRAGGRDQRRVGLGQLAGDSPADDLPDAVDVGLRAGAVRVADSSGAAHPGADVVARAVVELRGDLGDYP
jgi:hypothetical protein